MLKSNLLLIAGSNLAGIFFTVWMIVATIAPSRINWHLIVGSMIGGGAIGTSLCYLSEDGRRTKRRKQTDALATLAQNSVYSASPVSPASPASPVSFPASPVSPVSFPVSPASPVSFPVSPASPASPVSSWADGEIYD